jgi:glutathione S-transferase
MSANDIDHYVTFVPVKPDDRKKILPSGGTLVPELKVVNEGADDIVLADSEAILHWLDENCSTNLFPTDLASELSMRASDKTLAAMVMYYNWVDYSGYSKSMQPVFRKYVPGGQFWPDFVVDWFLASTRDKFRRQVGKGLELIEGDDASSILDDEPRMRAKLIDELEYFQGYLLKSSTTEQDYLLPDTKTPTAADFSVYAQLERLVGAGTASDVNVAPALQELKDNNDTASSLKRLWEWHDLMRERFPVQFKGKRPPEELLEKRT